MAAQIVKHWIDPNHEKVISIAALVGAVQFIERAFFLAQAMSQWLDTFECRLERAITDFERAIQLKPNYAERYHALEPGQNGIVSSIRIHEPTST